MYPKFTQPRILTSQEQKKLLRVVRAHASPRDRALLSLALGTGLRLRELRGLNVGDVSPDGKTIQWRVCL
jgi:integrase